MERSTGRFSWAALADGNALTYMLWVAGAVGALAVTGESRPNPIANRDFAAFWNAGKLAASGHAARAYDQATLSAVASAHAGVQFTNAYPYPPHFFFLTVPLSWLPLEVSFAIWTLLTVVLFLVAASPFAPLGFPRFLAILTPAAILNFTFGQTGFLYGALWLFAFSGSAFAAALLTIKPNLGVLVAAEEARRRQVLKTAAIVLALVAISAAVFGFDAWRACIAGLVDNHLRWVTSGSYRGWYFQMTTPYLGYGLLGWLAFAAAALLLLVRRFDAFTAATAAFLVSPYGFQYDMTVICLGFGVLLFERWRLLRPWQAAACVLAFLSPAIARLGTWFVPPILLAGLYVMTRLPEQRPVNEPHGEIAAC